MRKGKRRSAIKKERKKTWGKDKTFSEVFILFLFYYLKKTIAKLTTA